MLKLLNDGIVSLDEARADVYPVWVPQIESNEISHPASFPFPKFLYVLQRSGTWV